MLCCVQIFSESARYRDPLLWSTLRGWNGLWSDWSTTSGRNTICVSARWSRRDLWTQRNLVLWIWSGCSNLTSMSTLLIRVCLITNFVLYFVLREKKAYVNPRPFRNLLIKFIKRLIKSYAKMLPSKLFHMCANVNCLVSKLWYI